MPSSLARATHETQRLTSLPCRRSLPRGKAPRGQRPKHASPGCVGSSALAGGLSPWSRFKQGLHSQLRRAAAPEATAQYRVVCAASLFAAVHAQTCGPAHHCQVTSTLGVQLACSNTPGAVMCALCVSGRGVSRWPGLTGACRRPWGTGKRWRPGRPSLSLQMLACRHVDMLNV